MWKELAHTRGVRLIGITKTALTNAKFGWERTDVFFIGGADTFLISGFVLDPPQFIPRPKILIILAYGFLRAESRAPA